MRSDFSLKYNVVAGISYSIYNIRVHNIQKTTYSTNTYIMQNTKKNATSNVHYTKFEILSVYIMID